MHHDVWPTPSKSTLERQFCTCLCVADVFVIAYVFDILVIYGPMDCMGHKALRLHGIP